MVEERTAVAIMVVQILLKMVSGFSGARIVVVLFDMVSRVVSGR